MRAFKSNDAHRRSLLIAMAAITTAALSAQPVFADDPPAPDTDKDSKIAILNQASTNGVFVFDYGVPSAPALNLIGLTPDKTTVQTSLKPFVLSLPQLVSGGADQSAALDISPFWLLGSNSRMGYRDYVEGNYLSRFEYRFRTDFALFTGDNGGGDASKAKPSQLALGFSIPLLDDSDPLTAVDPAHPAAGPGWKACLDQHQADLKLSLDDVQAGWPNLATIDARLGDNRPILHDELAADEAALHISHATVANMTPDNERRYDLSVAETQLDELEKPSAYQLTADDRAKKAISACTADANNFARFAPSLNFGAGVAAEGTPGELNGFKDAGAVLWLSGKYPLGLHLRKQDQRNVPDVSGSGSTNPDQQELDYWMVGGSARASFGSFVATGDSTTPQIRANTFNGWLGLERNSSWLILSGQAGYQTVDATDSAQSAFSKSGWRWLASGSLRISSEQNGIWLDLSYGSAHGTVQTLDDKTVMLSLNFGPANPANLFGENPTN